MCCAGCWRFCDVFLHSVGHTRNEGAVRARNNVSGPSAGCRCICVPFYVVCKKGKNWKEKQGPKKSFFSLPLSLLFSLSSPSLSLLSLFLSLFPVSLSLSLCACVLMVCARVLMVCACVLMVCACMLMVCACVLMVCMCVDGTCTCVLRIYINAPAKAKRKN